MSGGHYDHAQYQISTIIETLLEDIRNNDSDIKNEWGYTVGQHYSKETVEKLILGYILLELSYTFVHRSDWLYSGDDGEENFHERLDEDINALLNFVNSIEGVRTDNAQRLIAVVQIMLNQIGKPENEK